MKRDAVLTAAVFLFLVLISIAGIVWTVAQWNACRDYGFSRFYCVQHIMK